MKLLRLIIQNLKGIKDLTIDFNGGNKNIYGENGTGKTTISDAYYWLLFGKDTQEKADFAIRPLNVLEDDEYTDTSVVGIFADEINNNTIKFERILKPKYNKDNKLSGFTTEYKIDDEPNIKEMDYKKYIENICEPVTFKILSNPFYFSSILPWLERRQILFSLFEDIPTDLEIIQQNKKLSPIINFIDKQTKDPASRAKKIFKDQKKELQKKQKEIPVSIKALKKTLTLEKKEEDSLEITQASIKHLQKSIDNLKAKKLQTENNSGLLDKQSELKKVQMYISQFIQDWEFQTKKQVSEKEIELKKQEVEYETKISDEAKTEEDIKWRERNITECEMEIETLRQMWIDENEKEFEYQINKTTCYACGQELPETMKEKIQAQYETALREFNKDKSRRLEKIQFDGQKAKESKQNLENILENVKKSLLSIKKTKEKINNQCKSIEKQIEKIKENTEKYIENNKYKELSQKETEIQGVIQKISLGDNKEEIQKIQSEIKEFEKHLNEANEKKAAIKKEKEIKTQIENYKAEEKQIADQLEDVETKLILLNEFLRIKVSLIENKINDRFELASFKLFRENLTNDEVEEICEVTDKNGVPFEKGLNHSAQINIGSDIINKLSEYHRFYPVIFYDNAEASTHIIKTKNQQIYLYVTSLVDSIKSMTDEFEELKEEFNIEFINEDLLQTDHQIDEIIERYTEYKEMEARRKSGL